MKRKVKIVLSLFLLLIIQAGILTAQEKEKKNEQRIKIVVTDKSGTKVEIDTLIKDGTMADSIKLKNGEVIYITRPGKVVKETHSAGDHNTMFVAYSTSGKGAKGEKGDKEAHKSITIISGDSVRVLEGGEGNEVVIIKDGKHLTHANGGKIVTWSSTGSSSKGDGYSYSIENKGGEKEGKKTYNLTVTTDDKGNSAEQTRYVIAKDGMVVTIEGNDEAKAKELLKEVQAKLGVDQKDKAAKKEAKKENK